MFHESCRFMHNTEAIDGENVTELLRYTIIPTFLPFFLLDFATCKESVKSVECPQEKRIKKE